MVFERPTHAHVSLVRLGGVNLKIEVEYRAKSVYVSMPQSTQRFRINAEKFINGERQFRDSYAISKWDEKAERTAQSELNWQT